MTTRNYIAVAKQLEDNTILLSFPDFEGLTAIADSEENIQNIAAKAIKSKLAELKNSNIEAPEPKKIMEVSKNLQAGEFTTYVLITESLSFNNLKANEAMKDTLSDVTNKVDNFINKDIKKSVPEGKEHFLGIGGAILAILNTLLFPVYTITGFFGFGGGGANFFQMNALYMLFGLAFLAFSGITIYGTLNRDIKFLQISALGISGVFILCYILVFITALGNSYLSVGIIKFLLYLISVALIYSGYRILNSLNDSND